MGIAPSQGHISDTGWYCKATLCPSPNHDDRPPDTAISLLVIHNISLPPGVFGTDCVSDLFLNRLDCHAHPYFDRLRDLRVSAHFLIARTGKVTQYVSTLARAWHAGESVFKGRQRCNDFSIGIELEGTDFDAFTPEQYKALTALTLALQARHPLTDVAGHQHIAPLRKTDPGPFFDWSGYRDQLAQGLAPKRLTMSFPTQT